MRHLCLHIPDGTRDHTFPVREARPVVILFPSYRLTSKQSKPFSPRSHSYQVLALGPGVFCAQSPLTVLNKLKFPQVDNLSVAFDNFKSNGQVFLSQKLATFFPLYRRLKMSKMGNRKWVPSAQFLTSKCWFWKGKTFTQLQVLQKYPTRHLHHPTAER